MERILSMKHQTLLTNPNQRVFRAKPTSASLEFDHKGSPSPSASKLPERWKPSSRITKLFDNRAFTESEMQQQLGHLEQELKRVREEWAAAEEDKFRALDELGEMRKVAEAANSRLSEALSAQARTNEMDRVSELEQASIESAKKRDQAWQLEVEAVQKQHALDVEALASASQQLELFRRELVSATEAKDAAVKEATQARSAAEVTAKRIMDLSSELKSVNESLSDSNTELEVRQHKIDFLKLELERVKTKETELAEKSTSPEQIKDEFHSAKEWHPLAYSSSDSEVSIEVLEEEIEKARDSEAKMSEALHRQTKQFEEAKILLEEAKQEIISLQEKVRNMEHAVAQKHDELSKEVAGTLKSELRAAEERERIALSKVESLTHEIDVLKNELKLATEAEDKSRKAMDELALVLIEVSTENKELKEKLSLTNSELDNGGRMAAEVSNQMVKPTEEKSESLLEEARKEIDHHKSVSERLKLEADDSVIAWNQKELEFVNCIRRAEEESNVSKQENSILKASLKSAEEVANVAREENCKLRDILKQALTETSGAKEAAEIAKQENSQLKDSLMDKDDMLQELTRENERLRIKESAGQETIKGLKRLMSSKPEENVKAGDTDWEKIFKRQNSFMKEQEDGQNIKEILNVKFEEPPIRSRGKNEEEDLEMDEMLKGSIFDVLDSPKSQKPVSKHRKTNSSGLPGEGEEINLEDIAHLYATHLDETEDKHSQRKKKALLRRFGELMRITSFHRREASVS